MPYGSPMTKNTETDFSLKEWVMNRAANQMAPESHVESQAQATPVRAHAGGSTSKAAPTERPFKEEKKSMPAQPPKQSAEKPAPKLQEKIQEKSKMTRFSNGVASAVHSGAQNGHAAASNTAGQAVQQLQIVRLLQDLGERLRNSEKEREILWRELDGCRKLLTDIEDKTSKTEKAYITLESKMNNSASSGEVSERQAENDRLTKALKDKIEAVETAAGSAILRIEDAISENSKLSRRLDQVMQDKTRLIRKMEIMEETLTQTQDSLKAKALVLLTDQALAARTSLPQTPAWSGNDTLRMSNPQAQADANGAARTANGVDPLIGEEALFRKAPRMNTKLLVSLAVLGMVGGWGLSKLPFPSIGFVSPPEAKPAVSSAQAKTQEELMAEIATLANEVEPGAEAAPAKAQGSTKEDVRQDELLAQEAERSALASFKAGTPQGSIKDRITADAALPRNVREIEDKAFDGNAEAQHDLAAIYTAGHGGVKTDYAQAAKWFEEAAYNGVANAQYNLGVLYHQGLGVKQDTRRAIQLYRVAALNGHPEAQYNLGIAHIEGVGADYSPHVAASYFEKAASGGIVEAAYNLGLIEENGLLGETHPDEAIFWYKTAADEGNAQAREALNQLQKQRKLSDQDVARIHNTITVGKPNAFNPKEVTRQVDATALKEVSDAIAKAAPVVKKLPVVESNKPAADNFDPVIVAQIQEQLARLGLYAGEADGSVDAATREAVKSYQSMNKIKIDGNPSEDVLVHMLATEMQITKPAAGSQ